MNPVDILYLAILICGLAFFLPLVVILILVYNAPMGRETPDGFVYDKRNN